jgi:hypothetical protein
LPCNGTCTQHAPIKCGSYKCLTPEEARSSYECRKKCIPTSRPCKCRCPPQNPKSCGDQCLAANDTSMVEHEEVCIPSHLYCGGKCPDFLPRQCTERCYEKRWRVPVQTCDGVKRLLEKDECHEICVDEETYRQSYKDCNGKCISNNLPCKS